MNIKNLEHSFTTVLNHAFTGHCEELSHNKSTFHTGDTPCPEEKALHEAARVVQEFFKQYLKDHKKNTRKNMRRSCEEDAQDCTEVAKSSSEIVLERLGIGVNKYVE